MENDNNNPTADQSNNNSKPWLFRKGQSGNPSGRPKGTISLKTYAKQMLAAMTDDERQEFLHGLPKEIIWRLAEGNPDQTDHANVTLNIEISKEVADKYNVPPSDTKQSS